MSGLLDRDALLAEARKRAGLSDFGDEWFLEPMEITLKSMREEARLSEIGTIVQRERVLTGLVNRLRMIDYIRRYPEIRDEDVKVVGIVLGLPRTGSTMLHRMLSNAPGMTGIRWWETQNFAPFPGEERGKPVARREAGIAIQKAMLEAVPDLTAIHPFSIDAPDEEVIILDQFFVGTMPPSTMYLPSYSAWLEKADQTPGYQDLMMVLRFLQWQAPWHQGKRWVLKTPSHVTAPDVALKTFPDSKLIMTHRDIVQTVPSFCSMVVSLYKLASADVRPKEAAAYTSKSWAFWLTRLAEMRDKLPADRFIDVRFEDTVSKPHDVVRSVLEQVGVPASPAVDKSIAEWLEENAREKRAAHKYTLEEFGLSAEQLNKDFAHYRSRFKV